MASGEIKHCRHEVLGTGVLIETANQIAHRSIKFSGLHNRRVDDERTHRLAHGVCLVGGHPNEHLKVNAAAHPAMSGQHVGKCQIKQIVPRYADAERFGARRRQRPLEHSLVVGVTRLFRREHGQGPIVQGRINLLHLEIRAFDNTNLECSASRLQPLSGKGLKSLHGAQCLWQISLKHDSPGVGLERFVPQDPSKDINGHIEVFELLHIQIDERRRGGRSSLLIQG